MVRVFLAQADHAHAHIQERGFAGRCISGAERYVVRYGLVQSFRQQHGQNRAVAGIGQRDEFFILKNRI
jgi:hypothetical protein